MKIINKKNIISIICISYTLISIGYTIFEIFINGSINPTQLNIFLFLILSILGVGILSQHYRFDRFSPAAMLLLQYFLAVFLILVSLKAASFFCGYPS